MFNFWPFNRQLQVILTEIEATKSAQAACCTAIKLRLATIDVRLANIEKALKITGIVADHESTNN